MYIIKDKKSGLHFEVAASDLINERMLEIKSKKTVNNDRPKKLKYDSAMYDFDWENAVEFINSRNDGWRLPTITELELMYKKLHLKDKGDFKDDYYWSSTLQSEVNVYSVSFMFKTRVSIQLRSKFHSYPVRLVRDVK